MPSSLVSLSNEFASLVDSCAAPVVAVHARPRFNSSGVHWSPGVIVTAEHFTLRRDEEIFVTTGAGGKLPAELAGRDPGTDLAVLRIKDLASPTAPKSEAAGHRAGNLAVVIGRNKDSANAGVGVISSLGGPSQTWRGGQLDQVIRLDPLASSSSFGRRCGGCLGEAHRHCHSGSFASLCVCGSQHHSGARGSGAIGPRQTAPRVFGCWPTTRNPASRTSN